MEFKQLPKFKKWEPSSSAFGSYNKHGSQVNQQQYLKKDNK